MFQRTTWNQYYMKYSYHCCEAAEYSAFKNIKYNKIYTLINDGWSLRSVADDLRREEA